MTYCFTNILCSTLIYEVHGVEIVLWSQKVVPRVKATQANPKIYLTSNVSVRKVDGGCWVIRPGVLAELLAIFASYAPPTITSTAVTVSKEG